MKENQKACTTCTHVECSVDEFPCKTYFSIPDTEEKPDCKNWVPMKRWQNFQYGNTAKQILTGNEYQALALRTAQLFEIGAEKTILNCALGLSGESGEVADHLKKHLFQGHALDKKHMANELGDILWYIAICAKALGFDLETIMYMNIDKLKERYPNGFDTEKSLNRRD